MGEGKPLFIVLEGIDGAGTTTQSARLVSYLHSRGRRAAGTREPSGGPIGRLLRELLLGHHQPVPGQAIDGATMALLFAADRRDHLQREIEPLLDSGSDVVSDRYLLSSLAYQAVEADRTWVAALARGVRSPDLTLVIDLPVSVAAQRRREAGRATERYDEDAMLSQVAENYRALARTTAKVVVVEGNRPIDAVTESLAVEIDKLIVDLDNSPV